MSTTLRTIAAATGLQKLNSICKYPSILTYHELGDKGRLRETRNVSFAPDTQVVVTEKLDGTNTRIVLFPGGDYLIGSREELLFARGDLLFNPALGSVEAVRTVAERITEACRDDSRVLAIYGEYYGGKVTASSKEYNNGNPALMGFRVFDAWNFSVDSLLQFAQQSTPEQIAAWREGPKQQWLTESALASLCKSIEVETTPRIAAPSPPESVADTYAWLKSTITRTLAPLHESTRGTPEGVVVRTPDRKLIAKIRYEDYQRTTSAR